MSDVGFSALAALSGSIVGALTAIVTTYLTLHTQERAGRFAQGMARKEKLYGEFIEEASRLYSDAITRKLDEVSKFVHLYALVSKLRLFAPHDVISAADEVMHQILMNRETQRKTWPSRSGRDESENSICSEYLVEACRKEMKM